MDWFLTELQKIAGRYRWHYVAYNGQQELEQIAYRIWQAAGRPRGHHEEHWWQAQKEFWADKPMGGIILEDGPRTLIGQSISPLQAVVCSQTGAIHSLADMVRWAEAGGCMTADEVRAIDAAINATPSGHDPELRKRIKQTVGLEG